jgi:surface antigen
MLSMLAALLGGVALTATPAFAATTVCSGFTACTNNHGWSSHYTGSYWGQYSGHNCTNYVAYYEQAVNGMSSTRPSWLLTGHDAKDWASEASGAGITVSTTPVVGSVAQWGGYGWNGSAGHVAIVEEVSNGGATIKVSWDSYSAGPYKWVTLNSTDANTSTAVGWPSNFIYLGGVGGGGSGSGLTLASPLTTTAPSGLFANVPIKQAFTVKNNTASTITVSSLIMALRDPGGVNYDQGCVTGLALVPGASYTCSFSVSWGSTGTYTIWPDWLDGSGNWHYGQLGSPQTFTLGATPALAATSPLTITAPSGLFANVPLNETFTVKNTTGSSLTMQTLILSVYDPAGTQYNQTCFTGTMTLAAGQSYTCNLSQNTGWGSTGTYSAYPDWLDGSGNWHWGQLGPSQTFTLGATPDVIATSPLTISAPSGYHPGATLNETFTVKNTTGSSLTMQTLILAVWDPTGTQYNEPCISSPLTLAAGDSYTCNIGQYWGSTGTYSAYPDWLDGSGNWHWGQLGPSQTFTLT